MLSDIPPFRIAGNLYFVGTYAASSHLIDTGDGLILIDTGYEKTADVILDSMQILGFDIKDVKYIVHSHGHSDHTGGTKKLLALCNAQTILHEKDRRYIKDWFVPDFSVKDGDHLVLGNTDLCLLETPGHTEGTISIFFDIEENGRTYRAGMFGGAGTKQVTKPFLRRYGLSYFQRRHLLDSIERLKSIHVDILVGNHSWHNNTRENYEKLLAGEENPFLDPTLWNALLEKTEATMQELLKSEPKTDFVNYAHRGAPVYVPENTMLSFYLGLYHRANGIETDVRLTKDGVPVLFHDKTLLRVTGEEGEVSDYTFDELQKFRVKNELYSDKIPSFDDFLAHFAHQKLTFAIELKGAGTAKPVADLIRAYGIEKKVVITSFKLTELLEMRAYAPELKAGYLTKAVDDALLETLYENGIDELCPYAELVTPEAVTLWHRLGFNVRAWGVANEDVMVQVYEAGADGMTVNFPDKLTAYLDGASM